MSSATPNKNPEKTKSVPKLSPNVIRFSVIGAVLVLVIAAALLFTSASPTKTTTQGCGKYRTDRVIHINEAAFNTEVASNQSEFDKGLGGRPCILPNQAMLFAFKQPGQYPFWMKGMKFPIDMIWVNSSRQIVAYEPNKQPSSYPTRYQNQKALPAQYVLEVKANTVQRIGIHQGTIVSF